MKNTQTKYNYENDKERIHTLIAGHCESNESEIRDRLNTYNKAKIFTIVKLLLHIIVAFVIKKYKFTSIRKNKDSNAFTAVNILHETY